MDKTININLGGILFQVDEEAFRILHDYLQAINTRFANVRGGQETIEDIESRIAEIFHSHKGPGCIITKENVDAMILTIGKPEDFDQGGLDVEVQQKSSDKRKMYRNTNDTIIGGVCSGIAAYLSCDPVLIRILFIITALIFGIGFYIYIALWIALPAARTETQKRAMYGNSSYSATYPGKKNVTGNMDGNLQYNKGYVSPSRLGGAINEVFMAIGKVFYIIMRVFLMIIGVSLLISAFLMILCFVMIFIFKFPGVYSGDPAGLNLVHFQDFLSYIVGPSAVTWIVVLASIAVILPLIALIYWGVKMIFWFRANDGAISLISLVVWVMSIAALAIFCFNEGISYAETGKTSIITVLPDTPDTLYISTDNKLTDLKYDKQFSLPHKEYSIFINDEKKELYIRPYISVNKAADRIVKVETRKRSTGRNEIEAVKKTDDLLFNYSIKNDTLKLDEYFTVPSGRKWAADEIGVHLFIPAGTVLKFTKNSRVFVHPHYQNDPDEYTESGYDSGNGCWIMKEYGLEPAEENSIKK